MRENIIQIDLKLRELDNRLFKQLHNENIKLKDNEVGQAIESLALAYFKHYNFNYEKLNNQGFQKYYGDYALLNKNCMPIFCECKSSHTWNNIPKLALDYAYYKRLNGQEVEYIQNGSNDNQGYIHYLKADIVFCYNKDFRQIYIIHEFQTVRNNILNLLERYNYDWDTIGHVSTVEPSIKWDYSIEGKYSRILNLELTESSIERFGGHLVTYQLSNDIIEKELKKAESVGSTHDF